MRIYFAEALHKIKRFQICEYVKKMYEVNNIIHLKR